MNPVEAAKLVCAAYRMYGNTLAPAFDAEAAVDWDFVGHLTALDALLDAQAIGLGQHSWYGFLARSKKDLTQYVVVIRGTETGIEWLIDLGGTMGFGSIYDSLQFNGEPAAVAIGDLVKAPATITVIGHSLGAVLATYLTKPLVASVDLGVHVEGIYLASPKPGGENYVRSFDAAVGPDNYRVFNYLLDLIPHAPPSALGFRSLPSLTILRPEESTFKIPFDLHKNHAAESYLCLLQTRSIQ